MTDRILKILEIALTVFLFIYTFSCQEQPLKHKNIYVSGQCAENDLVKLLKSEGAKIWEYESPDDALEKAKPGSAVLLLGDGYPDEVQILNENNLRTINEKGLKVFAEFAALRSFDKLRTSLRSGAGEVELKEISVERVVVTKPIGEGLKPMDLMTINRAV